MTDPASPGALPLDDPALQNFIIERELGGGGMARLFLATDRQFERTVVIKILTPSDLDRLSIDRFRREIAVATSLQHPNIVPILSAGELGAEPRIPFFVMPFVEGESLRERLLRGPLSVREAVHIARDVARALRHAHERGIVHRDIKPGNVLLSAGAAVVSDFGVAKALLSSRQTVRPGGVSDQRPRRAHPSLTVMGTSLGTPAYMAPEQAAADPNVDHRADIYALGIVLYEMLVGAPPFQGRTPQELLRAQLSDAPPPIATRRYDVPALLADLIAKCLQKDPAVRPKSAADVLGWLDDPAVVSGAFATTSSGRSRRWVDVARAYRGVLTSVLFAAVLWMLYLQTVKGASLPSGMASVPQGVASRPLVIGPISAVGGDSRARALADALVSELANALGGVPGIRVRAPGLSSGPKGASGSADSLLRTSGAAPFADSTGIDAGAGSAGLLRIEGTVQRESGAFRVLVRAIDVPADVMLWSGSFDGQADSLFALQQRVALAVSSAVSLLASPPAGPP
jgi:TolB-like protein